MTKKLLFILYTVVILCMGVTTFIEKSRGTAFVSTAIYGSWWFSALWALLTATAVVWFVQRRVRRASVVLLHLSFVIILAGALFTHLFASQGMVHLRIGESVSSFIISNGERMHEQELPFTIRLDRFEVRYHEGTRAPSDYVSIFTITGDGEQEQGTVSMNNIFSRHGIRLYQSSYDQDGKGSYLSVNSDPYGIPVTYLGYALLFLSLVWILFDSKGAYRHLLSQVKRIEMKGGKRLPDSGHQNIASSFIYPLSRTAIGIGIAAVVAVIILLLPHSTESGNSQYVLPKETAERFGKLYILYNDRICPLQTFAIDFTKKLYGKRSYRGLTAEQVLTGFIFWGDEWNKEPLIKLKGGELKSTLQLPAYCSVNTFFNSSMGGYILGPYVQEYYRGNGDKFHQDVAKIDDKLQLVMDLRRGIPLKIFPFKSTWYSPTDKYPDTMEEERQQYMKNIFSILNEQVHGKKISELNGTLDKMLKYQKTFGPEAIPSPTKTAAERLYNSIPLATILFMFNLSMGLLCLTFVLFGRSFESKGRWIPISLIISFLTLTLCLVLRWIISGTIPMANGYETMLLMAWMIMLTSLFLYRRFPIILIFGFLMSGFFLLVSHISQMDPQISHIMPVLASPLLTIHVSIIMMAFALLSLTFICGLTFLLQQLFASQQQELMLLSKLFLYPALTCLGYGIFIGAIWANVSWGTYWSWDPKEVWALITFMIYGIAVHDRSIPLLHKPSHYHLFIVFAFLTILMTYFGVNYFLGGMHSYA